MSATNQAGQKATASSGRLTDKVIPDHYDIKITPDLARATFSGEETIILNLIQPTAIITLHATELTIAGARLRNEAGNIFAAQVCLNEPKQEAVLQLDGTAGAGRWFLELSFSGILNDKLRGFYRSRFHDAGGKEHIIATTKFEPSDARRAFPCFDEPGFKAVFQISLTIDQNLTSISNSPVSFQTNLESGKKLVCFAPTIKMSSYLVAYIVGDFAASEPVFSKKGIPIRVYCVPGKEHLSAYALAWARFSLDYFSDYFGIDYQGAKLDLIAIPDFASGAMENFAAITFRETALLLDEAQSTHAERLRVADVVCHENAHMWFGDLVTMSWWNGLWLNEAFATFMSALAIQAGRPEWKFWQGFNLLKAGAMHIDGLHSSRSIEFHVESPQEARAMFDILTYEKGCAVLRMLELYLGEDIFRQGCALYMLRHAWLNTETNDLWQALARAVSKAGLSVPVAKIMDTWVFQQGYPLVSIEAGEISGVIVIRQRPFRYLTGTAGTQALWQIPVAVRAGTGDGIKEDIFLLTEQEQRFYVGEDIRWLVANTGGQGFYRVDYAEELKGRLLAHRHELSASERFNLLSDLWAATQAGSLALADYLSNLELILSQETDTDVFCLAIDTLDYLQRIWQKASPDNFAIFVDLVKLWLEPSFERLGWQAKAGEDPRDSELRGSLVRISGRLQEKFCCRKATELFQQYLAEPTSVSADLLSALIEITAAGGDEICYEQMLKLKNTASTPQQENRFLFALAHFRQTHLVERTLAATLSGQIRVQDAPQMVRALFFNPAGGLITWNFVKNNWKQMTTIFPLQGIIRLCNGITALVDPQLEPELKDFFAGNNIKGNEKSLAQNLETLSIANSFFTRESKYMASI